LPSLHSSSPLSLNERNILDLVCRRAPIARVDIAAALGLTGASITRLTKDLEEKGLLVEQVLRTGARGQPSKPLSLNAEAAYSAGIYFSHTFIEVGLVDLVGRMVSVERMPLARASTTAIVDAAQHAIAKQIKHAGIDPNRLVGAGVAVPGDFSVHVGQLSAHNYFPELDGQDVRGELSDGLSMPVYIENDAASAAIGERIHGAAHQFGTVLFVHLGHGVGGGVTIDGRLYRGAHGNAGIIGMAYPNDKPRPSGRDLFEHLQKAGLLVSDFSDLDTLWPDTCAPLATWIERAGDQLAKGIEVVARVLDPQAVVLGGRMPPHIIDALHARISVNAFALSRHLPVPPILSSRLGSRAGVLGAASLPMYATFFSDEVTVAAQTEPSND